MSDYLPGEIVDVTIKGVRIAPREPGWRVGRITYEAEHGEVYALPPQAAITRVVPEVLPGDLWRGREHLYFAVDTGGRPELVRDGQRLYSPEWVTEHDGPLTLVHREPVPEPKHWPPMSDDRWGDGEGNEWVADRGSFHLSPGSEGVPYAVVLRNYGGLTLVYRDRS